MKILVTGANGFIGRRLVDTLVADGHTVVVFVRKENRAFPPQVQQIKGDILNIPEVSKAAQGCHQLYHLAARVSFDPLERDKLLQVNGEGTKFVLQAAEACGVEKVLVVSSACTFGLSDSAGRLLTEESCATPEMIAANPYLASKLACENAALTAAGKGQHVVIACPTTVYGPGDFSLNSGTLVKKVASARVLPVPAGGSNMVDVDDVVKGLVAVANRGKSGQKYLLGGTNLRFDQIFSLVSEVVGHTPLLVPIPVILRRPMAAAAWFLGVFSPNRLLTPQIITDLFSFKFYSFTKASEELAWVPEYSPRHTLERAWRFYQKHGLF